MGVIAHVMKLPQLPHRDDDDTVSHEPTPGGIRSLRISGGSTVTTIPPRVLASVSMRPGDDVVVAVTDEAITITSLSDNG
jgi:hypothetical protein